MSIEERIIVSIACIAVGFLTLVMPEYMVPRSWLAVSIVFGAIVIGVGIGMLIGDLAREDR